MQPVELQPLLTVLLVAALQGRVLCRPEQGARPAASAPGPPGPTGPRRDFSRFFGAGPGPGGGQSSLGPKAPASGFVEPVDLKSFFGEPASPSRGLLGAQQQGASPFFGASSRLPFATSVFGAVSDSAEDSFPKPDFTKSKRGAGGSFGSGGRGNQAANQDADDDFFHFDFSGSKGNSGGAKADFLDDLGEQGEQGEEREQREQRDEADHGDQAEDRDEFDEDERRPLQAGTSGAQRYPSYSSYYHTRPEQLKQPKQDEDDFSIEDEDGAGDGPRPASENIRDSPSGASSAASGGPTTSAEAYDSNPFNKDARSAEAGSSSRGPAKFQLQGGFVPSPIDPLASSPRAARHPPPLKRTRREEADDAFFESYAHDDKEPADENQERESEDDKDDYRFGPEFFSVADEDEGEAGGGQARSQAAHEDDGAEAAETGGAPKAAGSCKKVKKKGSVCMVCTDPDTGGNYEQCQYTTEPETQSYSFGRSSSYGNPQSGGGGGGGGGSSRRRRRRREEQQADKVEQPDQQPDTSLEQLQDGKYEDYFSFLFPELTKEKTKKKSKKKAVDELDSDEVSSLLSHLDDEDPFVAETTAGEIVGAAAGAATGAVRGAGDDLWLGPPSGEGDGKPVGVLPKKDLERMLGEFQQKDRSHCTKREKDHMTCYLCVDKKGMQHEDCMFVAASEPQQSHVAFQQSSEFKQPAASNSTPAPAPTPAPGPAKSRPQRAAVREEQEEEGEDKEPVLAVPDDGMFSEETKPVFDKTLRMSLPKYMLERTEHERVFDEVLAAGV